MEINMAKIIHNGKIVEDNWIVISSNDPPPQTTGESDSKLLLPFDYWNKEHLSRENAGQTIGVWLAPNDEIEPLIPHLDAIPAIGIFFPSFVDGRGYSLARLLRQRHGFLGELRAFGDILRDQVYFLHQCGFDALCLREDQDIKEALTALKDYSWSPFSGH